MNTRILTSRTIPGAAVLIFAAVPAISHAQSTPTAEPGGVLQVIFSLLLVALLLAGSLYLLKRLTAPRGAASTMLRVISGTAVGTRERIVLVEVGETWLVLGVAPGQVTKLHELPRQPLPSAPGTAGSDKDFATWLKQVLDRRNAS